MLFCFEVHQPVRLSRIRYFDESVSFWESENLSVLKRVSEVCYRRTNALFEKTGTRGGFSISGVALEQLSQEGMGDVLDGFRKLAKSGNMEPIAETQYHSLSSLVDSSEFYEQVGMQSAAVTELFGVRPLAFTNTELIFSSALVERLRPLGFRGVFAEGTQALLDGRSPNRLYSMNGQRVLTRNFPMSDDVGFRFSDTAWSEYPLTAEKYADWIQRSEGDFVVVYLDYETFGEHHKDDTGIFAFWERLVYELSHRGIRMLTPSEALEFAEPSPLPLGQGYTSWADREKDLSAWLGNDMQRDAFRSVYSLEAEVKNQADPEILRTWRVLTESDHLYYCSTKKDASGDVHLYFNPYKSPYVAYINLMNAVSVIRRNIHA